MSEKKQKFIAQVDLIQDKLREIELSADALGPAKTDVRMRILEARRALLDAIKTVEKAKIF